MFVFVLIAPGYPQPCSEEILFQSAGVSGEMQELVRALRMRDQVLCPKWDICIDPTIRLRDHPRRKGRKNTGAGG